MILTQRSLLRLALAAVTLTTCSAWAQQTQKPEAEVRHYRLDFVVKEVEGGKVINSRSYSITASTERQGALRTGSRVPYATGGPGATATQFQYYDLGVSIDANNLREIPPYLSLSVTAEISSVLDTTKIGDMNMPVVRQNRWSSTTIVPLKKPTTIYSSDDATTKRQMQLELTATPLP
jgi:hypothetical protein